MKLLHKKILVTGGAVRIGKAICEELATRGCLIVVHYNNSKSEALSLVKKLHLHGAEAFPVCGDLSGADSCRKVIETAAELAGGLDVLVNNASVFHKQPFMNITESDLRREIELNSFAPIFLSQAFVKLKRESTYELPYGKIINLLDQRVAKNETGALPYNLSKKMLSDFTKLAALELAPEFTVNAVAPGPVLPPPGKGDDYIYELAGTMPLECQLIPKDIAKAVVYLLEADAVTGQTIFVDGGQGLL